MDRKPRLRSRQILSSDFGTLERFVIDRMRFDGTPQTITREVYERGPAAAILLYDRSRGTIVMVRQFRAAAYIDGHEGILVEVPAGKLDGEDATSAIVREVVEETGFVIKDPSRVFEVYMSPACFTEKMTFFIAPYTAADRISQGGGLAEEDEDIEVLEPTLSEALAMITRGEIIDAKTIMLLHYAEMTGLMRGAATA